MRSRFSFNRRAAALALALAAMAPTMQAESRWKRLFTVSQLSLTASSAADAATSWGKLERNNTLAGRAGTFGTRGLGIKLGVTGGIVVVERLLVRNHPERAKVFAVANWGLSGAYTAAAVHNAGVAPPRSISER